MEDIFGFAPTLTGTVEFLDLSDGFLGDMQSNASVAAPSADDGGVAFMAFSAPAEEDEVVITGTRREFDPISGSPWGGVWDEPDVWTGAGEVGGGGAATGEETPTCEDVRNDISNLLPMLEGISQEVQNLEFSMNVALGTTALRGAVDAMQTAIQASHFGSALIHAADAARAFGVVVGNMIVSGLFGEALSSFREAEQTLKERLTFLRGQESVLCTQYQG